MKRAQNNNRKNSNSRKNSKKNLNRKNSKKFNNRRFKRIKQNIPKMRNTSIEVFFKNLYYSL